MSFFFSVYRYYEMFFLRSTFNTFGNPTGNLETVIQETQCFCSEMK